MTYCPSGDTCDMNATRRFPHSFPRNELHVTTSWLRITVWGATETSAYMPLSLRGPSRSMPSVLPSREKEWQLAQVCNPDRKSGVEGKSVDLGGRRIIKK